MTFRWSALAAASVLAGLSSCQVSGIGDPCVPEDEYQTRFSGYELTEVDFETRSFQCETRVCLVNHFQGRVSCPYGQSLAGGAAPRCHIPGSSSPSGLVTVDVRPELKNRRASDAVYCSCRCAGKESGVHYCQCPTGFSCTEILRDVGVGGAELAGSYCIESGTAYDAPTFASGGSCDIGKLDCGSEAGD